MNKLGFWLGITAIALGVIAIVKDYFDGQGFGAAGLLAVAVGLVVVSVTRNTNAKRNRPKNGA